MFKLSIGDTIHLVCPSSCCSVIGKVKSYTVGYDINDKEVIRTVDVKGITSFSIARTNRWASDSDIWKVVNMDLER